ncbi:hypothetical protein IWW50_000668 [Coemansia erecta]|nr:hypothetical protein GGF43_001198 [Coemansia sp. RSA 2618]KAJ2829753.1 hypothetical protein IWW50_000668 [Coemansia erecta]
MSSSSSAVQRPLVISEEKSKDISMEDATDTMQTFLNAEAGVQAAPSGLVQQLIQLQRALGEK